MRAPKRPAGSGNERAPGNASTIIKALHERALDRTGESGSVASIGSQMPRGAPVVRRLKTGIEHPEGQRPDPTAQYEATVEELRTANEELQSSNEELRQATEELGLSREEFRAINQELTIVNQELNTNLAELAKANGDLANLIDATNVATIFLDRQLCIQRYTPGAAELFRVLASDVGRPLSDLVHQLDYPEMLADAARVIQQLGQIEKEVRGVADNWWLARMQPYRTPPDRIGGVVLTFVNITARKKVEDDLRRSEAGFRQLADAMPQIVWAAQPNGNADYYNQQWYDFTGLPPGSAGNEQWPEIVHTDDIADLGRRWARCVEQGEAFGLEFRLKRASDGAYRWFLVRARAVRNSAGEIVRWLGTSTDISERKAAEEAATATASRLRLAMNAAQLGTWEWGR